ncbi:NAD(P)-binding Rossmann-fold superfamily protein [Tanacetum coccineum]
MKLQGDKTGRKGDLAVATEIFESLIAYLSDLASSEVEKSMDESRIVLVAGATGGVGRIVVEILQTKGLPVRLLVRNEEKARKMLAQMLTCVGVMALKLHTFRSKVAEASNFWSKHVVNTRYKETLEKNKNYILDPPTIEKCQLLSDQLLYIRLARSGSRKGYAKATFAVLSEYQK